MCNLLSKVNADMFPWEPLSVLGVRFNKDRNLKRSPDEMYGLICIKITLTADNSHALERKTITVTMSISRSTFQYLYCNSISLQSTKKVDKSVI